MSTITSIYDDIPIRKLFGHGNRYLTKFENGNPDIYMDSDINKYLVTLVPTGINLNKFFAIFLDYGLSSPLVKDSLINLIKLYDKINDTEIAKIIKKSEFNPDITLKTIKDDNLIPLPIKFLKNTVQNTWIYESFKQFLIELINPDDTPDQIYDKLINNYLIKKLFIENVEFETIKRFLNILKNINVHSTNIIIYLRNISVFDFREFLVSKFNFNISVYTRCTKKFPLSLINLNVSDLSSDLIIDGIQYKFNSGILNLTDNLIKIEDDKPVPKDEHQFLYDYLKKTIPHNHPEIIVAFMCRGFSESVGETGDGIRKLTRELSSITQGDITNKYYKKYLTIRNIN